MTTPRLACRILCGILLTGITPILAQATTPLEREIEFVRKLAADLGFVSLAKSELAALQKEYRGNDEAKRVRQLSIDISLLGARADARPEERRRLFKEAVEASQEFIRHYADEPVADQARRTLLEASFDYGQFLVDEIDLAAEDEPEKLAELRAAAAEVFQGGIEAATQVQTRLAPKRREDGSAAQRDYYVAWLYKSMLQREYARVAEERDRNTIADMSRETFEELILDVGEETLLGQRAWFEMSKLGEVLGDLDNAFRDFEATIDTIVTALDSKDVDLPLDIRESMINLLQEAYDRAAETLFALGRIDDVIAFCQQFRESLKKYGAENADPFEIAHPRFGHPVFLVEARAMAETGKPELVSQALAQVQRINEQHPSDIIGVRAKNALRQILEGGANVSGVLLFEVAKGAYQEREYDRAIHGFKRAYGVMTPEEKTRLGLETWATVATAYGLQNRYLESTLAAIKALEDHGRDDPAAAEAAAEKMERAWNLFLRDVKGSTPVTDALGENVIRLITAHGGEGSAAKGLYRDANRLVNENKFDEAAAAFARIAKDTPYYEPSQSMLVQMWQRAGDFGKARAAAKAYQAWVATPEAALEARELQVTRDSALTTVEFWLTYLDYLEATGQAGTAADPTRYDAIIAAMQRFVDQRGKRDPGLAGRSFDMIARMQSDLGRIDKAEENYRTLRSADPNSPLVPALATAIFKAHWDMVKAIETERQGLIAAKGSQSDLAATERKLTTARRAALAMVVDYTENSAEPAFDILYAGVLIGKDLTDWPTVERIGRKCIQMFGSDPRTKKNVDQWVLPAVGEALMRQSNKFADAVSLLSAAAEANPSDYPVKRLLSLAQGGWFEFDDRGNITEVLGMDDPVPAYDRYYVEYQRYALNTNRGVTDYSLEYYQFYLEAFMLAKRASRKNSEYKVYAETIYNKARGRLDDFKTLKDLGPDGLKIYNLFQSVNSRR